MRELLVRAGFKIRSAKRADCAKCTGRSRGTVSYTERLAYCHRCKWRTNDIALARELEGTRSRGLEVVKSGSPAKKPQDLMTSRPRDSSLLHAGHTNSEREPRIAAFAAWRRAKTDELIARAHRLRFRCELGKLMLADNPDDEFAWQTLADCYREEAQLEATLDFLLCTKMSVWLDGDSTIAEVFEAWQQRALPPKPWGGRKASV
jgi:hypothetical protein